MTVLHPPATAAASMSSLTATERQAQKPSRPIMKVALHAANPRRCGSGISCARVASLMLLLMGGQMWGAWGQVAGGMSGAMSGVPARLTPSISTSGTTADTTTADTTTADPTTADPTPAAAAPPQPTAPSTLPAPAPPAPKPAARTATPSLPAAGLAMSEANNVTSAAAGPVPVPAAMPAAPALPTPAAPPVLPEAPAAVLPAAAAVLPPAPAASTLATLARVTAAGSAAPEPPNAPTTLPAGTPPVTAIVPGAASDSGGSAGVRKGSKDDGNGPKGDPRTARNTNAPLGTSANPRVYSSSGRPLADPTTMPLPNGGALSLNPPPVTPGSPPNAPASDFVTTAGVQFRLSGKPFHFVGMNAFWWILSAAYDHEYGRQVVGESMAAAQRLGMRVGRTWAFNDGMPRAPGVYDEEQFQALDFIIHAARQYGLRLVLALGNFWNAFKGPEEFVYWGAGRGQTIMTFYSNPTVKQLYKDHIRAILTRVNVYNGIVYKDDPTIMGWNVLNEPRCPGCNDAQRGTVEGWMAEMVGYTKSLSPHQLASLGTEGFFMPQSGKDLHLLNPGAGAQCEGEDWPKIGATPGVDYLTLHVYERHMEYIPVTAQGRSYVKDPDWLHCNFACYIQWLVRYIQAHMELAGQLGKPLVLEEFGLTWWREDVRDRRSLLAVVYRMLVDSTAAGSSTGAASLAGALLWNGAANETSDQDGYNVRIDRWPTPLPSPPPNLRALPPILPFLASPEVTEAAHSGEGAAAPAAPPTTPPAAAPPDAPPATAPAPSITTNGEASQVAAAGGPAPVAAGRRARRLQQFGDPPSDNVRAFGATQYGRRARRTLTNQRHPQHPQHPDHPGNGPVEGPGNGLVEGPGNGLVEGPGNGLVEGAGLTTSSGSSSSAGGAGCGGGDALCTARARALLWQAESLDGFRRGYERGSCAHESSRTWRPPLVWSQGTYADVKGLRITDPQVDAWRAVPDVDALNAYAWPLKEADLIAWAASAVNGRRR